MKKKCVTICFLMIGFLSFSQKDSSIYNEDRIDCGNKSLQNLAPFDYSATGGAVNSWSKVLYLSEHIKSDKKKLKGLAFYIGDCSADCVFKTAKNQKIYIKEVDYAQFEIDEIEKIAGYGEKKYSYEPNPEKEGYVLVFDGKIDWKRSTAIEKSRVVIKFNKEFEYSGNKNLIVYYLNENNDVIRTSVEGCDKTPKFYSYREVKRRCVASGVFDKDTPRDSKYRKRGSNIEDKPYVPITEFIFGDFEYNKISQKKSTIEVSRDVIKADGLDYTVVTVRLFYESGKKVANGSDAVEIEVTKGTKGTMIDNQDGTYTMYLTSTEKQGDAIISAKVNGKYLVDEDGRQKTVTVNFTLDEELLNPEGIKPNRIKINRGFSPNKDGKNDVWVIVQDIETYFPENTLQVFDTSGQLVYKASPYKNDWNGESNVGGVLLKGKKLPVGAYLYLFDTGKKRYKGFVYINY